jgi:hypothetical protein
VPQKVAGRQVDLLRRVREFRLLFVAAAASGLGTRHGAGGIRKYTRQQAILVTRVAMKRDVHMFPYTARRTKLFSTRSQIR